MAVGPKRVKLFASAEEVSKRDSLLRLTRRPHPLEAMHSTRGQEAYGLVTVLNWIETKQGGQVPIRATYGEDGPVSRVKGGIIIEVARAMLKHPGPWRESERKTPT